MHYDAFIFKNPNIKAFSDCTTHRSILCCTSSQSCTYKPSSLCNLALLWSSGALAVPISQVEAMIRLTGSSKPKVPLWTQGWSEPSVLSGRLCWVWDAMIWPAELYLLRQKSWCTVGAELIWRAGTSIKREWQNAPDPRGCSRALHWQDAVTGAAPFSQHTSCLALLRKCIPAIQPGPGAHPGGAGPWGWAGGCWEPAFTYSHLHLQTQGCPAHCRQVSAAAHLPGKSSARGWPCSSPGKGKILQCVGTKVPHPHVMRAQPGLKPFAFIHFIQ